jgi:hypothetical protein
MNDQLPVGAQDTTGWTTEAVSRAAGTEITDWVVLGLVQHDPMMMLAHSVSLARRPAFFDRLAQYVDLEQGYIDALIKHRAPTVAHGEPMDLRCLADELQVDRIALAIGLTETGVLFCSRDYGDLPKGLLAHLRSHLEKARQQLSRNTAMPASSSRIH